MQDAILSDEQIMRLAIKQADVAASQGEVPVGAVVVMDGRVVSCAYNRREQDKNALAHAEVLAIEQACKKLGGWRLWQCELFVTLEPCPMCTGAIINSRIKRVVYGASDEKAGCCASVINLFELGFNHHPIVEGGLLKEECAEVLSDFFAKLRERKAKKEKT